MTTHAGWRSRGYLPHFDSPDTVQHVVFRLADALPPSVIAAVERSLPTERLNLVESTLDQAHGERLLADSRIAAIVEAALMYFDAQRYHLLAWCVMPTHVHVLVAQMLSHPLSSVIHSWKSYTATAANKRLNRAGAFWAPEWYDRFMRDEGQFETTRAYVEANPVAAGLCDTPQEWRFSSAKRRAGWKPAVQGS